MSQSVQYCLLDPLVSSGQSCPTDDHWVLRDYAARVLAHIVGIWGNSVNHLERYTEKTLREALHDLSRPFACHYGAVMGLMYLGTEVKTETVHLLDRHQRDRERRAAGVRQQLKQRAAQQQKLDKFTPASDTDIEVIDVEEIKERDRNEENPGRKRKHNSPSPDVDFSQFLGGDSLDSY
ncbi:TAF6L-like protein [Mya arenaria]|uniref:TAF6L-like protein n=1 Tax=Mya arenaria TaxID=6604 RepID=A0ABY7FEK8_MYAAR|nr:TAF6L-like protein [Mya arenaria]